MSERWLNNPPPQTRKLTKDSKVSYADLAGWIDGLIQIENRKASSWYYTVLENHIKGLPPVYIQRCTCLGVLDEAVKAIKKHRPPRGQRGGHFTTSILVELNNQIAKLKRNMTYD
jgi:hypothetical protein